MLLEYFKTAKNILVVVTINICLVFLGFHTDFSFSDHPEKYNTELYYHSWVQKDLDLRSFWLIGGESVGFSFFVVFQAPACS